MPSNYFNMTRAQSVGTKPGYSNEAFIAPKSWFTTIQEPVSGGVGGAAVTISADHAFGTVPTGAGFIKVYGLPKSAETTGTTSGDAGALVLTYTPKIFLPGDSADLQVMLDALMNDDHILLMKDIKCPDGAVYQFGCDCSPVQISKIDFQSGKRGDGSKGYAIELDAICRFFYGGTIDLFTPGP